MLGSFILLYLMPSVIFPAAVEKNLLKASGEFLFLSLSLLRIAI
jgi:hypothetical protein